MKKILLSLSLLVISITFCRALPVLGDSAVVSLLTNSRTNEIYGMYGHTAIRVKDTANHLDLVFNYGTFDFDSPNFTYRFTKGDADYMLSVADFRYLPVECYLRGVSVHEQKLNLLQNEKQQIFEALLENAKPENCSYKYNFLFDNCSTRPRLIIENNINGKVIYKDSLPTLTFRQLVHDCTGMHQWLTFGIDLILGSPLDRKATDVEQMFLPNYLENGFSRAVIVDSVGAERKLVLSDDEIISAVPLETETEPFLISPVFITALFMVIVFAVSYMGFRKNRFYWGIDLAMFLIYGLAGALVFFMSFVSSHPATFPNYNLFVLHPLHLIFAVLCLIPSFRRHFGWYHVANTAILAIFLLLVWFLPQQFALGFLFLTFALFFRSLFQTLIFIRRIQ